MKKRLLSMIMALCLMFTTSPTILFAKDTSDTIIGPNGQVYEIQDFNLDQEDVVANDATVIPQSEHLYSGAGTKSDPYMVTTAQALQQLGNDKFNGNNVTYSYIQIVGNIDLSTVEKPEEWNGYFKNFYGELYGADPNAKITGIANNCFLITNWGGGVIRDLTIDPAGQAGLLTFVPARINGKFGEFKLENVTVSSNQTINLDQGDNQANYAPFIYAGAGQFTMENCVSDVDIVGTTYGSIFHGYYPMDTNGTYVFRNCVNKGDLTMRHAAMFFGNNTPFHGNDSAYSFDATNMESNRIQFYDCKNEGKIHGTQSANIFATRAAANGGEDKISESYEEYFQEQGFKDHDLVQVIGKDLGMKLYYDDAGNLSMSEATSDLDKIAEYTVSVYSYVTRYAEMNGELIPDGTDRLGAREVISGKDAPISLKYYGLCDYPMDTEGLTFDGTMIHDIPIVKYNETPYYWVNSEDSHPEGDRMIHFYVGTPDQPATQAKPDLVELTAYDASGTVLGSVFATPAELRR